MKHFKMMALGLLVAGAVLALPLMVSAEVIDSWIPTAHDYGEVALGASESQIFTVTLQDE
jgi:hypothetical protein